MTFSCPYRISARTSSGAPTAAITATTRGRSSTSVWCVVGGKRNARRRGLPLTLPARPAEEAGQDQVCRRKHDGAGTDPRPRLARRSGAAASPRAAALTSARPHAAQLLDVWQSHLNLSTYYWPQFEPVSESNKAGRPSPRAWLPAALGPPSPPPPEPGTSGPASDAPAFCPARLQVHNNPDIIRGRDFWGARATPPTPFANTHIGLVAPQPPSLSITLKVRLPVRFPATQSAAKKGRTTGCFTWRSRRSTR